VQGAREEEIQDRRKGADPRRQYYDRLRYEAYRDRTELVRIHVPIHERLGWDGRGGAIRGGDNPRVNGLKIEQGN
jgi:hypothetical protein